MKQREIVLIDEELCDGCGECVPACAEGALQIINGKARLVSDRLCDGLGACLGNCPRGAIRVVTREAAPFDEEAVRRHHAALQRRSVQPLVHPAPSRAGGGGCPGSSFAQFRPAGASPRSDVQRPTPLTSELAHWPVKLRLLSPSAPVLQGAHLLVAADCVPVAYPAFQQDMLRGKAVVIGCPKFDDLEEYVERFTAILETSGVARITVVRMEVPCCRGITAAVAEAHRRANSDIPVMETVVSLQGEILEHRVLELAA